MLLPGWSLKQLPTRLQNGNEKNEDVEVALDMVDILDEEDNMDREDMEAEEMDEVEMDVVEEEAEAGVPRSLMAGAPRWQAESLRWAGHNMRHLTTVAGPREFGCPN